MRWLSGESAAGAAAAAGTGLVEVGSGESHWTIVGWRERDGAPGSQAESLPHKRRVERDSIVGIACGPPRACRV